LNANVDQVQLALMHLLDNLTFDLDSVSEIAVEVQRDHGAVAIQTTFTGGSIPEVQLRRALALPLDLNVPGLPVIGGASLGLVRAVMERHSGSVEASITDAKQLCVTLRFPDDHPEKLTTEVPLLKPKSEPA
jgi:light-regulated signal transduction histidine kinase (bacteriophytochrome)